MSHFIITAIVVLAAAKANAQAKDNLTNQERREKSEAKRRVANYSTGQVKKESRFFKSKVIEGYLEGKEGSLSVSSWQKLSQREREVLKLIAEGYKNKEIAEDLCNHCHT